MPVAVIDTQVRLPRHLSHRVQNLGARGQAGCCSCEVRCAISGVVEAAHACTSVCQRHLVGPAYHHPKIHFSSPWTCRPAADKDSQMLSDGGIPGGKLYVLNKPPGANIG
eukprot:GHRR01036864.1.p2 GENE.GHRR01036864.1~~GHRR01036864.1.p2  ORF type:complete len:110 (+),score=0.07 GHRR01036864.1:190-519(+)